ncbi:TPA: VirB4 family type IV secretion/conjugal transfer ATPase [Yersinia enterocolitica]|nr:VirB4 family type IV secretion/conjugal transfer ATPase [Yersinia enterocolitica]
MAVGRDQDTLYKALTRPTMFLGVPIAPMFIGLGATFLAAFWISLTLLALLPFVWLVLKLITKIDEKIFQLLGIKRFLFADKAKNGQYKKEFFGHYYSSQKNTVDVFTRKNNNEQDKITMLDLEKAIQTNRLVPYSSHLSESAIITTDGFLTSTWRVEGISFATRSDEDLDRFKYSLNNLLRTLAADNLAVYYHDVRDFSQYTNNPEFSDDFPKELNDRYIESFKGIDFMENRLFVTLVYRKSGAEKVSSKLKSVSEKKSDIEVRLERFNEICDRFESSLMKFGAKRLTCYEIDGVTYSQQLEFFNYLLTGKTQKIRLQSAPINTWFGGVDYVFGKDTFEIRSHSGKTFGRGIEIKDWVSATQSGLLDELISLPCQYVLTQSFAVLPKNEARKLIDRQQKRMKATEDDGVSQLFDLGVARDELASGNLAFGEHHLTIMLYSDSLSVLSQCSNMVLSYLEDVGFQPTLSNIALDEGFFAQLPANFRFRPRVSMISSLNFAGLISLHNNSSGKPTGNAWGNCVTTLKTRSNTPFSFNFHQTRLGRDDFGEMRLAHALLIGQAGTGKTALLMFFLMQMQQYRSPKSFPKNSENTRFTGIYFDKDYGAEIGVRALGGKYNRLVIGQPTGFNPFMMNATQENIAFLKKFVILLVTSHGEILSDSDIKDIDQGVNSVMRNPKHLRKYGITTLLSSINTGAVKTRLENYCQGKAYGWMFDNDDDYLDFDAFPVYGFDGTEILNNEELTKPITFYLLHRIMQVADGRRLVLIMDEFWKWLKGKAFEEFIYDGLKTMRKRNAFIIGATQSPEEVLKSDISRAIIEQTETFIMLPNSKAQRSDYVDVLGFSEKEFEIISSLESDSREFLIKKGNADEGDSRGNVSIAKLDLSGIGRENMKVLSGSLENAAILDSLVKELGDDPKVWLPVFKQKCV